MSCSSCSSRPVAPAASVRRCRPPDPIPRSCPTSYAAPDPNRPRVDLAFDVAADHATVSGTERVTFTPDVPVTELVFRLTANTRPSVAQGSRVVVTSARVSPGGGRMRFTPASADPSTQGGLLRLPLGRTVAAGDAVRAEVRFTLTLGRNTFDRFGRAGDFAYFGSGQPLLAWERGHGWHTEDLLDITAESATSEAMRTTLRVTAPSRDVVIASGNPSSSPVVRGRRTWTSTLATARDVAVAAGPFRTEDSDVAGVRLHVGAPSAGLAEHLTAEFRRAISAVAARLGPFPFPSLAVARVPVQGGGIEYPGAILMLDDTRRVAVHETAHQWFYAMVGNSQARDPWLDEAFATYTEQQVDAVPAHAGDLGRAGRVGSPVQAYGADEQDYYATTYDKGSAALEAASAAAGTSAWDAAVRCYVARNAWRIARPTDLRTQLVHLPAAVTVLRRAGALD